MLRTRDRLIPAAAFLALVATGVLVLVLVTSAVDSGRQALEESILAEVQATARAQDAQIAGQISGIEGYVRGLDLDLEVGSDADRAQFERVAELLEELDVRTGFFLTDAAGVVTQGLRLGGDDIGSPLDRPLFPETLEAMREQGIPGAVLPVARGLTTDLPTVAYVFGILDAPGGRLRGSFVLESEVAIDSTLNRGVRELGRDETGSFHVFDALGTVVASTNPSLVAQPVPDPEFTTLAAGVHRRDGEVQVLADVAGGQWRVAFTQDADEFDAGLAGPLQQVGLIVVVVFLAVGVAASVALVRRLRAAREEEERLRQLNETQEEFISIVSHELRTPVAGVLGFLQTTMDHWDSMSDTERFNALRRSASNARRLQGLTRDVLDSQAAEAGRMSFAMSEADLRDEVVVAVDAARSLYPRLQIDLQVEADDAPVVVDVDRIQQVLTNLLDNAAKVSPPDGRVHVRLWREGERAIVSVTDQGPGLAPDLRDRIFEKFVRGRETGVTGTGLGLYISRQILTAHGGDISADPGPDGGACFAFELPIAPAAVPQ